jgi:hypothetical protein
MRTPAGRPWRVITISSSTASRKYFEKSSFTAARATSLGSLRAWRPLLVEPRLCFGFCDDREDLDFGFCNVIEHPDIADTQTVLRLAQAPKTLDSTLADFRRRVCQMDFKGFRHARANRR